MKYLLSNNFEAILEVFRVFANLARHKIVRNCLVDRKGDLIKMTKNECKLNSLFLKLI